jgi:hypothetical protein
LVFKPKTVIKTAVKLFIEADGNFVTIVIRLSKKQLLSVLDRILPDE